MKPPHTPRSPGDLPQRVPGAGRQVRGPRGRRAAQDDSTAGHTEPAGPAGSTGTPAPGRAAPRLSRIASLGALGDAGRAAPASGAPGDGPGEDAHVDNFARRRNPADDSADDLLVPLTPVADGKKSRTPRREGSRGALGVVGVVALLAVGGVVLTLGLVGGDDDKSNGASAYAGSGGASDVVDAAGDEQEPSVKASREGHGKGRKHDDAKKPSASASPTSGASGKASAAPGKEQTAPAKGGPAAGADTPAAAPGVTVFSHDSKRCIDVAGGAGVPGAALIIRDCSSSASQHWTFEGGTMRTLGMCVQLAGGSTDDGTALELGSCDGGPAQRFVLNVRHDIANSYSDKCADVRDSGTANGTRLQLWSCSGDDNQKWSPS